MDIDETNRQKRWSVGSRDIGLVVVVNDGQGPSAVVVVQFPTRLSTARVGDFLQLDALKLEA
jgi:hypothetical protein